MPFLTKSAPTPSFGDRFATTSGSNILNGFEPNGKRPTCDSYEARLMELLDSSTRKGSNECIAVTPRALDHGLN
jgi:hypothetical protein